MWVIKLLPKVQKKVRPNLVIRPIKKGAKVASQNKSGWGGKKNKEKKKSMFAWLDKINNFKKTNSEKKEDKNK